MSKTEHIRFTVDDQIGIVTLNNPPENFLLDPVLFKIDELTSFIETNDLRGLIITGEGRNFSSGANLHSLFELIHDEKLLHDKIEEGNQLLCSIEAIDIPVVSAIEGVCFGGGFEIALASHIRICSEAALFAFPEVNHNLMPGLGGIQRITNLLKGGISYEMILGGDMMDAGKAFELNVVDHIVGKGTTLEYSTKYLKQMVQDKPRDVIRIITKTINFCRNKSLEETIKESTRQFCRLAIEEAKRRQTDPS